MGPQFRIYELADDPILEQLAALEGRGAQRGRHLVAEVDGEIVAALPLAGGEPVADPFRPTAHLVSVLRLRAAQLSAPTRSHAVRMRAWQFIADRPLV
jgi:hypothetical protein